MERSNSTESTLGVANEPKPKDALPKTDGEGERDRFATGIAAPPHFS